MSKPATTDIGNGSERNLNEASAFAPTSPYEIYQQWESVPVYKGFIIDDLLELELGDWARTGGKGAFVNLDGAAGTCDTVIQEIAPGGELRPQRHLFEEAVFILSGQGATTLWNDGGRKHTLEWQKGSLFSLPLNTWFQHFNAQGREPVRMISLTDATMVINRYRNLDYIFNNPFTFGDRYQGDANEWGQPGRYLEGVKKGRVWESNFIADLWQFQPKDYKERGGGNRTTLFEFVDNTMSAHLSEFPVGKYKKAHRHGAGAHIVMLTGSGYSFLWEEGAQRKAGGMGPYEHVRAAHPVVAPALQQRRRAGPVPGAQALGLQVQGGRTQGHRRGRQEWRRADRVPGPGRRDPSNLRGRVPQERRRGRHGPVRVLSGDGVASPARIPVGRISEA